MYVEKKIILAYTWKYLSYDHGWRCIISDMHLLTLLRLILLKAVCFLFA